MPVFIQSPHFATWAFLMHRTLIVLICLTLAPVWACGGTFYIDSQSGDDAHDGHSPEQAWRTLSAVNGHKFAAGDWLLFAAGSRYEGRLLIDTPGVRFDMYGQGALPRIDAKASTPSPPIAGQRQQRPGPDAPASPISDGTSSAIRSPQKVHPTSAPPRRNEPHRSHPWPEPSGFSSSAMSPAPDRRSNASSDAVHPGNSQTSPVRPMAT